MQLDEERAHIGPEVAAHRHRRDVDEIDLQPPLPGSGGDLGADEAGSDDHHPLRLVQCPAKRARVVPAPELVHVSEARPR
jgi:hypothetical protein